MTQDLMERLQTADPERDSVGVPPIESLLALVAAEREPEPAPRRRRRRSPRLVATGAAVAAAIIAVTLALTGRSVDVAADARAALEPQGYIIHTVTHVQELDPDGTPIANPHAGRNDMWVAERPYRMHSVIRLGAVGGHARAIEGDYADGVTRYVPSGTHRIVVHKQSAKVSRAFEAVIDGRSATNAGADPVAGIRQLLADRSLKAAGETTLAGRRVLRLTGQQPSVRLQGGGMMPAVRIEYLINPDTSAPVQITSWSSLPTKHGTLLTGGIRTTFETYERIPITETTERLLRIDG